MTTLTLPKQSRGPGKVVSPSVQVTAANSTKKVDAIANMDAADLADTSLGFAWGIEYSADNVTFQPLFWENWVGGVISKTTGQPIPPMVTGVGFSDTAMLGLWVRLYADPLPRALNLGATVTIN